MTDQWLHNFAWPNEGDEPFIKASDGSQAYVQHYANAGFYAQSYKWSADELIVASEGDPVKRDVFSFAVLFLYRHFLELKLKQLVEYSRRIRGVDPSKALDRHDLSDLWTHARATITAVWPDDGEGLDEVEHCVRRFAKFDSASFAFRYPTDKKGKFQLHEDLKTVDMVNLKSVMDKVGNFLDGAIDGVDDAIQNTPPEYDA